MRISDWSSDVCSSDLPSPMPAFRFADRMLAQLDELGRISESPDYLCRTFLTPEHRTAHETVAQWMREAGMEVEHDRAGNLVGRYAGATPDETGRASCWERECQYV